jgi:hypothetical protein
MTLSVTSAPWQQVDMPALDLRRFLTALSQAEGVRSLTELQVSQRAAGANMSVDISSGYGFVQGDAVTGQGMYLAYNDATYNLTGFTAAHATLPRIDRVAIRVRDAFHGDAANDISFQIVTGTATSGATLANLTGAAAVPSSHLLLANVLVPAAATTITSANIANVAALLSSTGAGTELEYQQITSDASFTGTSSGAASAIINGTAITYTGTYPIIFEFFSPSINPGAGNFSLGLYDGSTLVMAMIGTNATVPAYHFRTRFTPSAGSHTYQVKAWTASGGTGTVNAGTGTGGADAPAFIRITRAT